MIRHSASEIQRGDHLLPRRVRSAEIPVGGSPGPIEGRVVYLPDLRMELGQRDVVYLNRGSRQASRSAARSSPTVFAITPRPPQSSASRANGHGTVSL